MGWFSNLFGGASSGPTYRRLARDSDIPSPSIDWVYFNLVFPSSDDEDRAWDRMPGHVKARMAPVIESHVAVGVCESQGFPRPKPGVLRHLCVYQSGQTVAFYFLRGTLKDVEQVFKAVAATRGSLIAVSSPLFTDATAQQVQAMRSRHFGAAESSLYISGAD